MTRIGALAALLALLAAPAALAQAREPVESFVTAQYYHGLPPEQAALYGPEDVPALLALLEDARAARSWAQIIDLLGTIGDDAATPALTRFVEDRFEGEVRPEVFAALAATPTALGAIAAKGGARAEAWLERGLSPEAWRARPLRWSAPLLDEEARPALMSKLAISGYARIGAPRTLERLRATRAALPEDAPARAVLAPALREAIALNELIVERGPPVLRRPDFERLLRERMEIAPQ